jgi:hypothetical protein
MNINSLNSRKVKSKTGKFKQFESCFLLDRNNDDQPVFDRLIIVLYAHAEAVPYGQASSSVNFDWLSFWRYSVITAEAFVRVCVLFLWLRIRTSIAD